MAQTLKESEDSSGNELSQALEGLNVETELSTGVLNISDGNEETPYKPPPAKSLKCNFHDDFKARLQFLTLGKTPPLPYSKEQNLEYFEAFCTENHQLGCEYIHFKRYTHVDDIDRTPKYFRLIIGPTLSARRVMLTVKSHYRNEKWLENSNTMEIPLQSSLNQWIVQDYVSKCLDDERRKLYNFIKFLETKNPC